MLKQHSYSFCDRGGKHKGDGGGLNILDRGPEKNFKDEIGYIILATRLGKMYYRREQRSTRKIQYLVVECIKEGCQRIT